jgi:hypothetical protein
MREHLPLFAARLRLGNLDANQMQAVVDALVDDGFMSENCLTALTSTPPSRDDVEPAFMDALKFFDFPVPITEEDAVCLAIRYWLNQIAADAIAPSNGLNCLMKDVYHTDCFIRKRAGETYVGECFGVQNLVGLYWSLDDYLAEGDETWHPGRTRERALADMDQRIVDEAKNWLKA